MDQCTPYGTWNLVPYVTAPYLPLATKLTFLTCVVLVFSITQIFLSWWLFPGGVHTTSWACCIHSLNLCTYSLCGVYFLQMCTRHDVWWCVDLPAKHHEGFARHGMLTGTLLSGILDGYANCAGIPFRYALVILSRVLLKALCFSSIAGIARGSQCFKSLAGHTVFNDFLIILPLITVQTEGLTKPCKYLIQDNLDIIDGCEVWFSTNLHTLDIMICHQQDVSVSSVFNGRGAEMSCH